MLLVPLALAVPGGAPEAGEEVVLAAGMPEGAAIDEPGGQDSGGDLIASVQVEVTDEEPTADEQAPSTRPPTKRRLSARASATPAPVAKLSATAARGATATKVTKPTATTEATEARVTTARVVEAAAAPPPPPASAAPAGNGDAVWDRLAVCESGNTNDPGPTYYGYWQFSAGTWTSMGEPGLPNEHSRARQLVAAKRLQAASGWGQWPDCSRRLGLQ